MKCKIAAFVLFFLTLAIPAAADKVAFVPTDPILPLNQVKTGMKAEVRTVLNGTKISSFHATLVGIIPRKTSPRNLILIRVDDPYIRANGGIAEGMSGSPVYVGGKLVGAIGYGWSFGDNNLGLVTPIEEMIKAFNWPDKVPKFGVSAKVPIEPLSMDVKPVPKPKSKPEIQKGPVSGDVEIYEDGPGIIISADILSDDIVSGDLNIDEISADIEMLADAELKPLAMPMLVDGLSKRITEEMRKKLGFNLVPLGSATSSGSNVNLKAQPKPGAAVGASLAWGDFQMGGIGTLTAKSKDGRFLAFGHPMVGQGTVSYPLTEASIIQVIPSIDSSFKLGYQGPIIGLITQDRPEAIAGYLGKLAPAISYTVRFNDVDNKKQTVRRFQTVADSFTGPVLGTLGMLGIIDDLWARTGEGTAILKYKFSGGNLPDGWERRNVFFSDTDLIKSLLKEFDSLSKLFALNQFQEIRPFGVDLDVEITSDARVVFIEKLEIADKKASYAPGDKVDINVTMRPWRKRAMVKKMTVLVPKKSVGFCEITVRGGGIEEPGQDSLITGFRAITNLKDLMKELSISETNNQIILEIDGPRTAEKGKKDKPDIEDMMDDRLLSEIKAERLKEGSLVIVDTNYYVEGLLRKLIKIKRTDGQKEEGPSEDEETTMRAEAEDLEAQEDAEAASPDGEVESRGLTFNFVR